MLPESVFLSPFTCADARAITVPTLLLTGDNSPPQFLLVADELAQCMPQALRAVIQDASHLLHGMNPSAYNATVLAFLARH